MLCHKDHPLAAEGTMSWPISRSETTEFARFASNVPWINTICWPQLQFRQHQLATTADPRRMHAEIAATLLELKSTAGVLPPAVMEHKPGSPGSEASVGWTVGNHQLATTATGRY